MLRNIGHFAPHAISQALVFLPRRRRKATERWLRGREEHRKLQQADVVFMSWAKSGRTWLRLMLSRYYVRAYGLPEGSFLEHDITWRGTGRTFQIIFGNVRELTTDSLAAKGGQRKAILDFPFDDPGHTPAEDLARLDAFRQGETASRTLVWLPSFLSLPAQKDLGTLVKLLAELLQVLPQRLLHLPLSSEVSGPPRLRCGLPVRAAVARPPGP